MPVEILYRYKCSLCSAIQNSDNKSFSMIGFTFADPRTLEASRNHEDCSRLSIHLCSRCYIALREFYAEEDKKNNED
jgi:hypothetical protein